MAARSAAVRARRRGDPERHHLRSGRLRGPERRQGRPRYGHTRSGSRASVAGLQPACAAHIPRGSFRRRDRSGSRAGGGDRLAERRAPRQLERESEGEPRAGHEDRDCGAEGRAAATRRRPPRNEQAEGRIRIPGRNRLLTIFAELTFLTPLGGLLAVAVVLPVAAYMATASRSTRGRALLRLAPPKPDYSALAVLASVPLLLGVAAAEPALRTHAGHRIRTDAQAIFVLDTSRSMAASAGRRSATRLAQAQKAAISLRDDAIAAVPSGLASLTTQLLPHLFPTADAAVFNVTVANAIGIEKPPPPALKVGLPGTSFWPLTAQRDQGYFDPKTKRRFVILMTDGESGPYPIAAVAEAFRKTAPPAPPQYPGAAPQQAQAPITLVVVRVGGPHDRIYGTDG